jgi:hypothetical protein
MHSWLMHDDAMSGQLVISIVALVDPNLVILNAVQLLSDAFRQISDAKEQLNGVDEGC